MANRKSSDRQLQKFLDDIRDDRHPLQKFVDGVTDPENAGKSVTSGVIGYGVIDALGNHQDSASNAGEHIAHGIGHLFDMFS